MSLISCRSIGSDQTARLWDPAAPASGRLRVAGQQQLGEHTGPADPGPDRGGDPGPDPGRAQRLRHLGGGTPGGLDEVADPVVPRPAAVRAVLVGIGGRVGQRQQDLGERDAVGQRVVQPDVDRGPLVEPLHEVDVPERAVTRQRRGEEPPDVLLQGGGVPGRRQPHLADVLAEVEVGYVAPARLGPAPPRHGGTPREDGVGIDQPALHHPVEPLAVDRSVEEHDALDHHQVLDAVHVHPDGVDRVDAVLSHPPSLSRGARPAAKRGQRRRADLTR